MSRTTGAQKAEGVRSLSGVPVKAFHLGGQLGWALMGREDLEKQ